MPAAISANGHDRRYIADFGTVISLTDITDAISRFLGLIAAFSRK